MAYGVGFKTELTCSGYEINDAEWELFIGIDPATTPTNEVVTRSLSQSQLSAQKPLPSIEQIHPDAELEPQEQDKRGVKRVRFEDECLERKKAKKELRPGLDLSYDGRPEDIPLSVLNRVEKNPHLPEVELDNDILYELHYLSGKVQKDNLGNFLTPKQVKGRKRLLIEQLCDDCYVQGFPLTIRKLCTIFGMLPTSMSKLLKPLIASRDLIIINPKEPLKCNFQLLSIEKAPLACKTKIIPKEFLETIDLDESIEGVPEGIQLELDLHCHICYLRTDPQFDSEELTEKVDEAFFKAILKLCKCCSENGHPLSCGEISIILNAEINNLNVDLQKLVEEGSLEIINPEEPNFENRRYK